MTYLTDVCDFQGGTQPPKSSWSKTLQEGYIRMLQIRDFTQQKDSYIEYVKDSNTLKKCKSDDILIGRYGASIGKILTGLEGAYNVAIVKTIPDTRKLSKKFLYYLLSSNYFQKFIKNVGSRAAQAGFNKTDLERFQFNLPSHEEQKKIVEILDQADFLRQKRKQSIALLNKYLNSVFFEMFGDPVQNSKNWNRLELKSFGEIITGNTPSRNEKDNYSSKFVEWIKTDNIIEDNIYLTSASEYLSETGLNKARYVETGAVLVACIAGSIASIGRVAIADRKVSFNQQINAIQPNAKINSLFLYWLLRNSRKYIQDHATRGMKRILTKGEFEKIKMIMPPIDLQNKFAAVAFDVENLKRKMLGQSKELENQFQALMHESFAS